MSEVRQLTEDEARDMEEAFLEEVSEEERKSFTTLPPSCSSGHGWCENGKCFVCCNGTWYKLVDQNNNQYSCSEGRKCTYKCNGVTYAATC